MDTFIDKAHRTLVFTDILMIGFIIVWFISILCQLAGFIPADLSNILWTVHTFFGGFSALWYFGLRARWYYTPEELRDVAAFHTSGCNCQSYSNMNSSWHGIHKDN
jgi:hypothetical protein